jgi:hypothetical protein
MLFRILEHLDSARSGYMIKAKHARRDERPSLRRLDVLAAAVVVAFAMAIALRPLPNYDIWWMLAVGRRIIETGAYIYKDPFTFTVTGAPWSPQSYASAIIFYLLFKAGGMAALTALRVLLVGALTALTFRTLRRIGAPWAVAAPLVVVMLVNSHSRLTDRGQLFEYVFIAWLMGFLITSHERRGRSFFVLPVADARSWSDNEPAAVGRLGGRPLIDSVGLFLLQANTVLVWDY